ncbi:rhodanese-like domain-containing protein [Nocardioides sp.]|uniref:rhodanese-like domain-containing protein n=1 Tax=Nocardioides sp. TaxID=35761 RepID=UPI0035288955
MTSTQTRAEQREARTAALKAEAARRQRLRVVAVVAAALAVFAAVGVLALRDAGGGSTVDGAYHASRESFRLPGLLDDQPVDLGDYAGTPVVVNFFASWCVYCNEELPGFVQVAQATDGQVAFVGVDTNDTGDGAAMASRFDLAGAGFALARDIGQEPAADQWSSYGSQGLPVTAFYDADGNLVDFAGGMLSQADLEQRLKDDFGVDVDAPDAAELGAPVIPLIPRGAYELLARQSGSGAVVVDLRGADEFAAGHLPGAVDVGSDGLADAMAGWDPSVSYFLYDADGTGAEAAATQMHDAGFKHVYFIEGGFAAWVDQGMPTS